MLDDSDVRSHAIIPSLRATREEIHIPRQRMYDKGKLEFTYMGKLESKAEANIAVT